MKHGAHRAGHESTGHDEHGGDGKRATVVLQVGGLSFASEEFMVERVLRDRPGVMEVQANPVSQTATATATHDTEQISVADQALGEGVWLPLRRPVGADACVPPDAGA